jgi:hypothetical protein
MQEVLTFYRVYRQPNPGFPMTRRATTLPFLGLLLLLGCAEDSKVQDKLKGLWVLESRTLSDGTVLTPPAFTACAEWTASDPLLGHLSYLATYGGADTQFLGADYQFTSETAFTRTVYNAVGGGMKAGFSPGFQAPGPKDQGSAEASGARMTLRHADGFLFTFEGSKLTVTHPDGTVDLLKKG